LTGESKNPLPRMAGLQDHVVMKMKLLPAASRLVLAALIRTIADVRRDKSVRYGVVGKADWWLAVAFLAVVAGCPPGDLRAQPAAPQAAAPFDVFQTPIDSRQIYRHFERTATGMMETQAEGAVALFQKQLRTAASASNVSLGVLDPDRLPGQGGLYEHLVKSTLYIGELYNCGRCDRTHAGFAGGVLISRDGLALTNYHVLESRDSGRTEGFYAMTWDGRCWPIAEILAASPADDVALIRLQGGTHRFHAAALASQPPRPMEPVRIVSHPYGEFYVMTEGEVSRYARMRSGRSTAGQSGFWLEVTAPFGSGSSGCGVFNERGEVVGLVSRIRPLFRNRQGRSEDRSEDREGTGNRQAQSRYVEMLIRKCVPLQAIQARFSD
jgi:S1-C subfamily serine protease